MQIPLFINLLILRLGDAPLGFASQPDVKRRAWGGRRPRQRDFQGLLLGVPRNGGGDSLHRISILAVPACLFDGLQLLASEVPM